MSHIRRIAYYNIEAASFKDLRELFIPIKGIDSINLILR